MMRPAGVVHETGGPVVPSGVGRTSPEDIAGAVHRPGGNRGVDVPVTLAESDLSGLVGNGLAEALAKRLVQRAAVNRRRGGFREGKHRKPTCGPTYEHRTERVSLPPGRDVAFRGHVRGAVEMMHEVGVLDSTDTVVALAMLTLSNEAGLLAWANQKRIANKAHVSPRTVRKVIVRLRQLHLIDWSHEFRNGRPYPNRYVFFLPDHWTRRRVLAAKKRVGPEPEGRLDHAMWCRRVVSEVISPTKSPRPLPPASKQGPGRTTGPASRTDASVEDGDEHTTAAQAWAEKATGATWASVLEARGAPALVLKSALRRGPSARSAVVTAVAAMVRSGHRPPGPAP
jgi:hypothetical protein